MKFNFTSLIAAALLTAPTVANELVSPNVSYNSVTELSVSEHYTTFTYGDDPLQFVEHWPAVDAATTAPLVVFIHGGCWLNAYDIAHTRPAAQALAQAGYEVASIEYRRTGDEGGGWPGTFKDIFQALLVTLTRPPLQASEREVVVMGHSAGGHLAILAGQALAKEVDHVVGLAAITDLTSYAAGESGCEQAAASFMANAEAADWQQADPAQQEFSVAITLLQGTADSIVPLRQAEALADQAEIVTVQDAGHFDWVHPHSHAWQRLLQTLEQLTL